MMKLKALIPSLLLALVTGQVYGQDKTNFIEAFTKSNSNHCMELDFEGLALFIKAYPWKVTFYAGPIIAHYQPDFLVTAYPRLGDSPLLESYAALGTAQNIISRPMVELLSGADAPASYGTKSMWGGSQGSDVGKRTNKTLSYYEAEVFGHPGNVFTWASKAFRGETLLDTSAVTGMLSAIPTDVAMIPQRVNQVVDDLTNNASTTLGAGFTDEARLRFDPVEIATNAVVGEIRDLAASTGLGQAWGAIQSVRDNIPDNIEESITGALISSGQDILSTMGGHASSEANGEAPLPVNPDVPPTGGRFDIAGMTDEVVGRVRTELGELTPDAIIARVRTEVIGEAQARVQEVVNIFQTLESIASADDFMALIPGVSAEIMVLQGLCPSDVDPFRPYYLSGTNVLSWRYKIPEIVYPQTYLPFSGATTIGTLFPGLSTDPTSVLRSIAQSQNYGSAYPRNGYLLQSHPLKAAAVASFRAAHVVTRDRQAHIYKHPAPKDRPLWMELDNRYDALSGSDNSRNEQSTYLVADEEETGRWQLIHNVGGEEDEMCHRFGEAEVNPEITNTNPVKMIGNIRNTFTDQWADDKKSDDGSYVFSLWRRYRCSPEPSDSSLAYEAHLYNVEIPGGPIAVLH